jgi:hypothetical protein
VAQDRWSRARPQRGKPRVYVQQFLELLMPEPDYAAVARSLGHDDPWTEDAAAGVMEEYLEELDDGSQCDTVHYERRQGQTLLMTVVSHPYRQETYDRLVAEYAARRLTSPSRAE